MQEATPGPNDYDTRVNSCSMSPERAIGMPKQIRWTSNKPLTANCPIYDTRPAVKLLCKEVGGGVICRAPRVISPHL